MVPELPVKMSLAVRRALEEIGRTEDIRFSPDNRTLAIAAIRKKRCLLLRIAVRASATRPRVVIRDFLNVISSGISLVHGLDFIDNQTLAIANRDGFLSIIEFPLGNWSGRTCEVVPRMQMLGSPGSEVHSPGSVAVTRDARRNLALLTCENFVHHVSRHEIDPQNGYALKSSRVLLKHGLIVPDGISVSHDGQWIAVSSHETHEVHLYESSLPLGLDTRPQGTLSHAGYPHGLRFTSDDGHIVVADAGERVVHIYERGPSWDGEHMPLRSVNVIGAEAFERGRFDPKIGINRQEGGPKGIDIDKTGSVLATTCEEQPLSFFSLSSILGHRTKPVSRLSNTRARWPWKMMTRVWGKLSNIASGL